MSIDSEEDILGLKRIGRIVALVLQEMRRKLRSGMTTQELDAIGEKALAAHGARPAPRLVYDFPGATCISINDESAHGIPGLRRVQPGDLVNIDVSAELDGYFADTGATVPVQPVTEEHQRLCVHTRRALKRALANVRAGQPMNGIGRAVESEARRGGFQVIKNLAGHGVGRHLHEYPDGLSSYYDPSDRRRFQSGLVVAVEPFLSTGATEVYTAPDRWTQKTPDGSRTAQYEHTVIVTDRKPIVVTCL